MANGGASQTPLPGWLGPIVQITTQVGVPTVFAGVLLYFTLFKVTGALDNIERWEDDRTKIIAAMQDSLIAALDRQTHAFERAMKENVETNKFLYSQLTQQLTRPYYERTPPSLPKKKNQDLPPDDPPPDEESQE